MRPYEIVVIFDADLDEETTRSITDRVTEQIVTGGGEAGRVDVWGKRRFAYEMKHRWEGYYVVLQVRSTPEVVAEVDRALSLSDEVLRHRVVRIPDSAYATSATPASAPAES